MNQYKTGHILTTLGNSNWRAHAWCTLQWLLVFSSYCAYEWLSRVLLQDWLCLALKKRKTQKVKQHELNWGTWLSSILISCFQGRSVPECTSRGTKDLGSRLKWSLVTEGHLLIYVLFLCSRDYLQITNEKNWVFGKYCGHVTGKTVLVSGKYALIKFHSNRGIQNRGFLITFTSCKKG